MSFKNFLSHEGILKALEELGYETPTPIQQEAIPLVMEGKDLLGSERRECYYLPSIWSMEHKKCKRIDSNPRKCIFQNLFRIKTLDIHPLKVPGVIHTDLLNAKLIPDPYYRFGGYF